MVGRNQRKRQILGLIKDRERASIHELWQDIYSICQQTVRNLVNRYHKEGLVRKASRSCPLKFRLTEKGEKRLAYLWGYEI